jgi:hypothetical protein
MRGAAINDTSYAVGVFLAFGRVVPDLLWFVLFPRVARKKHKQMIAKYLA